MTVASLLSTVCALRFGEHSVSKKLACGDLFRQASGARAPGGGLFAPEEGQLNLLLADDVHSPVSYTHLDVYKRQGMSQWGAYGMAQAGSTAEEIVTYYFKDVSIEKLW